MHVLDRARDGAKPELVRALGATYHVGDLGALKPDVVIECTGAGSVVLDVIGRTAPDGIVCLAGVSSGGHKISFDIGDLNRDMVLENHVVFGSVNANRRHYRAAAEALAKADKDWLGRLITRRVPLARWREAFEQRRRRHQGRRRFHSLGSGHGIPHRRLCDDRRSRHRRAGRPRRLDRLAVLAALRFGRLLRRASGKARARPLEDRAAATAMRASRGVTGRTR